MTQQTVYFFCALLITLVVIILLMSGAPLLTISLDSNQSIPLGTPITWIGMISLPLTVYWGTREMRKPTNRLHQILALFLKILIGFGLLGFIVVCRI